MKLWSKLHNAMDMERMNFTSHCFHFFQGLIIHERVRAVPLSHGSVKRLCRAIATHQGCSEQLQYKFTGSQ